MEQRKVGNFLGSILLILGLISIMVLFFDRRMFGSCPPCFYYESPFFYSGVICVWVGVNVLGYSLYRHNAKGSGIDDQMKQVYHISIVLLINGWTQFIILFMSFFPASFIGLPIGLVGLYGVFLYRSRPDKLRNYLLKRKESKEEPKVQA